MSRNLDQKIGVILNDVETMTRKELSDRIKTLVLQEVNFHKADHYVDNYDLTRIWSVACREMTELPKEYIIDMEPDTNRQRAYAVLRAITGELRRLKLIDFQIKYKRKKRNIGR